jgi:RNA polymerase sigma factor (sigma-70 family)
MTAAERDLVVAALPAAIWVSERYARRYGRRHDWRGQVQIELCKRAPNYRPGRASPAKWGRTTAHYACRSLMRNWDPAHVCQMTAEVETRLPDRAEREHEDQAAGLALLSGLNDRQRRVIWRTVVDGLSLTAVAHELAISVPSAMGLRNRALRKLRSLRTGEYQNVTL